MWIIIIIIILLVVYLIKFDFMNLLKVFFGIFYIFIIVFVKIIYILLKEVIKRVFILLSNILNLKKNWNLVVVNSFWKKLILLMISVIYNLFY